MARRSLVEVEGRQGPGHRVPPGEVPLAPPRASLGARRTGSGVWTCCGVDWAERPAYDSHLAGSHGGSRAAQAAPGGSGQGAEARAREGTR